MSRNKRDSEKGQATVEFALSMILLIAFTLFYLQITLVFGIGNYVHYATFMAARAYLSAGPDQGDQKSRANDVIIQTLKKSAGQAGADRFAPFLQANGGGGDGTAGMSFNADYYSATGPNSFFQGVRYSYKSRIFPTGATIGKTPPASAAAGGDGPLDVSLTAESWLGREPTYDECKQEMTANNAYFDNGC